MDNLNKFDLNRLPAGIIPTHVQHYVLMAAISEFEIAKHNWDLLKKYLKIDSNNLITDGSTTLAQIYDKLDSGSNRLLPMVYKNLQQLDDPLLQSIKSFYRYTWAKNHHFYQQFKNIAQECVAANIDVTMLKGLSTAFYYADDPAIRVMEDIDILIKPKQMSLFAKLCQTNFNSKLSYRLDMSFSIQHAALLMIDKNEIDIHWGIAHEKPSWNVYNDSSSINKVMNEANIFVLSPDYAFFHAIVHGVRPNIIPTIRWISDCYLIQKKYKIDWDKIMALAIKLDYTESMRIAIEILPVYGIIVPEYISQNIQAIKINQARIKFWLKHNDLIKKERSPIRKIFDGFELMYLEYKSHRKGVIANIVVFYRNLVVFFKKHVFYLDS